MAVMGAPGQQQMDSDLEQILANTEALLVKQTMKGCFQECLGCEAKSEFKVSYMNWDLIEGGYKIKEGGMDQQNVLYAIEESSCCVRLCWRDGRNFKINIHQGENDQGRKLIQYDKPCGMPLCCDIIIPTGEGVSKVQCPCCCLLPQLNTQTAGGEPLPTSSHYICDQNLCVPKIEYREQGEPVYLLKPETCCGGCCFKCSCGSGKGLIYAPFYFHDPKSGQVIGGEYNGENTPQIRKMWAGFKKECCSTADTFAVMFPPGSTPQRKAGLMGLTFLLDFTWFERQGE